jgi:hypothetical protein
MIRNYTEFCRELQKAGFSGAIGGKDDGVFGLFRYGWGAQDESALYWHTGDPDTDPWEWRMRVLNERDDIAYAKVFYKKAGYITKEWYPYFLAVRRGGRLLEEDYRDGMISRVAKCVYEAIAENGSLPLHEIRRAAGFGREDSSKIGAALTELQMKLYLTISGGRQRMSQRGEAYGWTSTVFCTTEAFWGGAVFDRAAAITGEKAAAALTKRILLLNPSAQEKGIMKFIRG